MNQEYPLVETKLNGTKSSSIIEHQLKSNPNKVKQIFNFLHKRSGIWYWISANFIFACCTFVLKLIPADMFDIMIMRFLVQTIVFGAFAMYKKYKILGEKSQSRAIVIMTSTSSLTNLCYISAYYFLPLSDLNTLRYTYIVWTACLAVIFLKEKFTKFNAISLVLTFTGLILTAKPKYLFVRLLNLLKETSLNETCSLFSYSCINLSSINSSMITTTESTSNYYYLGVALASICALTKSAQFIARKKLISTKMPFSVMNFQFTFVALLVSISYSLIRRLFKPEPYPYKWMLTVGLAIGFIQLITNTFYAKAIKRENLQLLTILGALDILYAVFLQYIFLRITITYLFSIGALLIVTSAVILSVHNMVVAAKKEKENMQNVNNDNL
ncbi:unnamed protein product [Didymodactylos carnosus]|uniref:EamA domain-containing protein n=1 Tax=Didymodactylos carnosus TaxID=1234261 RepID=A0A816AKW7_9BILA|nr:unnamed protein product [Didymodactylos carnosus]CAF4472380.1 unnamed protein product [Didymodactylos carnosus]